MRERRGELASDEPRALGLILAVALHVVIITAVIVATRSPRTATGEAGFIEGPDDARAGVSGMPATSLRFFHSFLVVDDGTGRPVDSAEVRDVLGGTVALSAGDGTATLSARPAAQLTVRVSKPGYDTVTFDVANVARQAPLRGVRLTRACVRSGPDTVRVSGYLELRIDTVRSAIEGRAARDSIRTRFFLRPESGFCVVSRDHSVLYRDLRGILLSLDSASATMLRPRETQHVTLHGILDDPRQRRGSATPLELKVIRYRGPIR